LDRIVNIVFSGRGGRGIITASDVCARAAFLSGFDVKRSASKGIAQRGGLVISHLRYGKMVYSPKIEEGMADFVIGIDDNGASLPYLSERGRLIKVSSDLINLYGRHINMYALGILSCYLPFNEDIWLAVIKNRFIDTRVISNIQSFLDGRRGTWAGIINSPLLSDECRTEWCD